MRKCLRICRGYTLLKWTQLGSLQGHHSCCRHHLLQSLTSLYTSLRACTLVNKLQGTLQAIPASRVGGFTPAVKLKYVQMHAGGHCCVSSQIGSMHTAWCAPIQTALRLYALSPVCSAGACHSSIRQWRQPKPSMTDQITHKRCPRQQSISHCSPRQDCPRAHPSSQDVRSKLVAFPALFPVKV